jgi:hypothetical protein
MEQPDQAKRALERMLKVMIASINWKIVPVVPGERILSPKKRPLRRKPGPRKGKLPHTQTELQTQRLRGLLYRPGITSSYFWHFGGKMRVFFI